MFVDRVEIEVRAGAGGNGCCSFRRERFVPRGGPDGGDGGHGGSVILRAEAGVDSLAALGHRRHWQAQRGEHGQGSDRHGRNGQDLVISVPPGTLVLDAQAGFVLKDLARPGDELIAARGGKGGKGNAHFKSSTNQAPRQCTPGGDGEVRKLILELKLIADVGLVGKPNAGKSTLLSRVSKARPRIADYPFTTTSPNLGLVELDLERSFVLADIPGLIEGAHRGVGLGYEFLRHVERTRLLIHLVEPMPMDGSDPLENYRAIRTELEQYDAQLAARPELLVVSKAELPGADEVAERLAEATGLEVRPISAVTGRGIPELLNAAWQQLQQIPVAS